MVQSFIVVSGVFQPSGGEQAEGEPGGHQDPELVQILSGAGLHQVQDVWGGGCVLA